MSSETRLTYWLKNQPIQNFGDMLSEMLFEALTSKSFINRSQGRITGDYDVVHLIGSVISNWHIERDLEYAGTTVKKPIVFWGCGLRAEEPIRPDLMARCSFLGVRGPRTRDILDLPHEMAIGDPGLLIPYIYRAKKQLRLKETAVCVPHFLDPKSDAELAELSGCELILRPNLPGNRESLLNFIDALVSAKFVLAGALHAAVVAYAYGIPFAYFDSGFVDVPFKWKDFAASINMPPEFVQTISAGNDFFRRHSIVYTTPRLTDLLTNAPFRVPHGLLQRVRSGAPATV